MSWSMLDPLEYGRTCGRAGISYLPRVTWRTGEDYIEFARGWREGFAMRGTDAARIAANAEAEAMEWRAELAAARIERTSATGARQPSRPPTRAAAARFRIRASVASAARNRRVA